MITDSPQPSTESQAEQSAVHEIVKSGPRGALTIAGISTAIVIGLWFAFYFFIFLPRGPLQ